MTDAATGKMGENDARLFAFVQSDAAGNVALKTIRPASYPKQYKGRTIPQHIHFDVSAEGYAPLKIQMVFDDDPAMDAYWREWAVNLGYPVVAVSKGKGVFEVMVKK